MLSALSVETLKVMLYFRSVLGAKKPEGGTPPWVLRLTVSPPYGNHHHSFDRGPATE